MKIINNMFNNRSTDIVEKTSGISQEKKFDDVGHDTESVKSLIGQYKNHHNILEIKRYFPK